MDHGECVSEFGVSPDGESVDQYTLRNASGLEVGVITYGGIIVSLKTPDAAGRVEDIVLGFETLDRYVTATGYFGAVIGRYGNRIAGGRFTVDGGTHVLRRNDGRHHLHGGDRGFNRMVWQATPFESDGSRGVVLTRTSPDGEEGYPGTLDVRVTYTLTDADELVLDYRATTDRATPVNLTQHSYFNLAGAGNGDVLGHEVMIRADGFTPVDASMIPTGEIRPVAGTPFDFRTPAPIGARIGCDDVQLDHGSGYDHNFVLTRVAGVDGPNARVTEPAAGRTLDLYTSEPGLQFYSGNKLDGVVGKGGRRYGPRAGFCLETQHYPDSPNRPAFPSTILRPDDEYRSRTVLSFGVAS